MIEVKILSYHSAQRYAVRQTVVAACRVLQKDYTELELTIKELKDWSTIEQYTPVLSAPSLVVNEKLVCVGRFPSKEEVIGWLIIAAEAELTASVPESHRGRSGDEEKRQYSPGRCTDHRIDSHSDR